MNFFKKIFRSKESDTPPRKKKEKASFLTWLCATKQPHDGHQQRQGTGLKTISPESSGKKSTISVAPTNNTKIVQQLSFHNPKSQYPEEQLKCQLINLVHIKVDRLETLIDENGLYGMANSQEPPFGGQQIGIWLKIGKNEEINSLVHIKPYYFDKIFVIYDEFGGEYSIQEIARARQNIYLKLQHKSSAQWIIDEFEKEFIKNFAFKLMADCFNKLRIEIIHTKRQEMWLHFNQQNDPSAYINDILQQMGFDETHEEYEKLQQQLPKGLTLQEYIDFMQHKQKLLSKYEGQNVGEYIKNKFLEKISSKALTPRNDSPRTVDKEKQQQKDNQEYDEYIMSVTANTLPRQKLEQPKRVNEQRTDKNENSSFEEEIFEFNVYKEDHEQEVKRIAISKERKKRSRSEDISVNDLHNDPYEDESDIFDKKD